MVFTVGSDRLCHRLTHLLTGVMEVDRSYLKRIAHGPIVVPDYSPPDTNSGMPQCF